MDLIWVLMIWIKVNREGTYTSIFKGNIFTKAPQIETFSIEKYPCTILIISCPIFEPSRALHSDYKI